MSESLEQEVARLRAAIAEHRAQKADDRCWLDDLKLYAVLDDEVEPDNRVGDKYLMLANCARFIDRRCEGGEWTSYIELERELNDAHTFLTNIGASAQYYIGARGKIFIPAHRTLTERIKSVVLGVDRGA